MIGCCVKDSASQNARNKVNCLLWGRLLFQAENMHSHFFPGGVWCLLANCKFFLLFSRFAIVKIEHFMHPRAAEC